MPIPFVNFVVASWDSLSADEIEDQFNLFSYEDMLERGDLCHYFETTIMLREQEIESAYRAKIELDLPSVFVAEPEAVVVSQPFESIKRSNFTQSHPATLTKDNLKFFERCEYVVSAKLDGIRAVLVVSADKKVYVLFQSQIWYKIDCLTCDCVGLVADVEVVKDIAGVSRVVIFDVMHYKTISLDEHLDVRRKQCIEAATFFKSTGNVTVHAQIYYPLKAYGWALEFYKSLGVSVDGLIFSSLHDNYSSTKYLKWKPPRCHTVDLRVMNNYLNGKYKVMSLNKGSYHFEGAIDKDMSGWTKWPIVEFYIVNDDFVPVRYRYDKKVPNSTHTVAAVRKALAFPVHEFALASIIDKVSDLQGYARQKMQYLAIKAYNVAPANDAGIRVDVSALKTAVNAYNDLASFQEHKELLKQSAANYLKSRRKEFIGPLVPVFFVPCSVEHDEVIGMTVTDETAGVQSYTVIDMKAYAMDIPDI